MTYVQSKLKKDTDPPECPRHSERAHIPTEKMHALQYEKAKKREKWLLFTYEKWKLQLCKAGDQLLTYIPESQLCAPVEEIRKAKET